jgi:hypothetical protein
MVGNLRLIIGWRVKIFLLLAILAIDGLSAAGQNAVFGTLTHQGRVLVNSIAFSGAGQFKFALVSGDGSKTYWANSAVTNDVGEPSLAVDVTVTTGLYSVVLGDTNLPNMAPLPISVFSDRMTAITGDPICLRVWFNDGANGWQRLVPDQRMTGVGFSLTAVFSKQAASLLPGTVDLSMLAPGVLSTTNLVGQLDPTNLPDDIAFKSKDIVALSNILTSRIVQVESSIPIAPLGPAQIGATNIVGVIGVSNLPQDLAFKSTDLWSLSNSFAVQFDLLNKSLPLLQIASTNVVGTIAVSNLPADLAFRSTDLTSLSNTLSAQIALVSNSIPIFPAGPIQVFATNITGSIPASNLPQDVAFKSTDLASLSNSFQAQIQNLANQVSNLAVTPVVVSTSNLVGQIDPKNLPADVALKSTDLAVLSNSLSARIVAPPDTRTRLYAIANNTGNWGIDSYSAYSVATCRSRHLAANGSEGIVLVYSTCRWQGDLSWSSQSFDLAASVEINGILVPVYFYGRRLAAMRPGTTVVSDPVEVQLNPGDTFWVRTGLNRLASTGYSIANGESGILGADQPALPTSVAARGLTFGTGEGVVYTPAAVSGVNPFTQSGWAVDSGTIPATDNEMFRPQCIVGYLRDSETRSVNIIGDSVTSGSGDIYSSDVTGGRGYARRALNPYLPINQFAEGGEKVADWLVLAPNRGAPVRGRFLPWAKYSLTALGNNDLYQGTNVARVQSDLVAFWTRQARLGTKVWGATIPPRSFSTDAFSTTTNQTVIGVNNFFAKAQALNAWLRAGAPLTNGVAAQPGDPGASVIGDGRHPLVGLFDVAGVVESSPGSGIWKAGVILASGRSTAASTTHLTDTSASWSTKENGSLGQFAGLLLWNTTRNGYAQIRSNTVNDVVHDPIAGQTAGDEYKIVQSWTADGTHPSRYGHEQLATLIDPASFP